jgi:hypothetical protein
MTTPKLIDRLASSDAMDAPLFREVARACWITLDPDDDRLARLMEMILVGAWRDACAELQAVVLPGIRRDVMNAPGNPVTVLILTEQTAVASHPTSECRAHLIAILRAREAQGHG